MVTEALKASFRIDTAVANAWKLTPAEIEYIRSEVGPHPCEYLTEARADAVVALWSLPIDKLIKRAVEQHGASRWLTKKSYFVDRKTELICHMLRCPPESVERAISSVAQGRRQISEMIVSYSIGVAFGRWTAKEVSRAMLERFVSNPFDQLPMVPPAAEESAGGSPILVSDAGSECAVVSAVRDTIQEIWSHNSASVEDEIVEALGCDLDLYFERDFFQTHITLYSKSRRTAPIYWPLSTASGRYTMWIYYPSLTSQTLFTAVNDFIEPKLSQVRAEVTALRHKGSARTRDDEKQFEAFQSFELELIEFRDTLLTLAPTYKPNHDDGVQITAAPLWPLFRHKPWQKVLKETWTKLEKGDYDWAHLAMTYWPERVREKCKSDKSLAIAHGLEDLYVEPKTAPKKKRSRKKAGTDE